MFSAIDPVLLSRIQFAFTVSFHIIFPTLNVGLGAWLAFLEGCFVVTGKPVYRRLLPPNCSLAARQDALGQRHRVPLAQTTMRTGTDPLPPDAVLKRRAAEAAANSSFVM
jgi:hypothetical protein